MTVLQARNELSAGVGWAEQAVTQMEGGDFDAAAASFALAADELTEAHDHLSGPLSAPAALIPVLAQHREAAIEMSGVGGSGAEIAAEALGGLDLESLRLIDGRIDLEALERLRAPFERTHRAMVQVADAATQSLRSPWLIGRAEYALRDFQGSVAEHLPSLDEAIDALDLAPRLLGVDRPQMYLVLFTPFSKAGGFGGSVAGYAELTADDGVLTLNPSGATVELDAGAPTDFRGVAELATETYAEATGRRVDGAIAIDPEVLVHLLDQAGVDHPSATDLALDPTNAASYLQAVLEGSLPDPVTLALDLGPLVSEGRLLVWSPDPAAEALFSRVGLDGTAERFCPSRTGRCDAVPTDRTRSDAVELQPGHDFVVVELAGRYEPEALIERARSTDARVPADQQGLMAIRPQLLEQQLQCARSDAAALMAPIDEQPPQERLGMCIGARGPAS